MSASELQCDHMLRVHDRLRVQGNSNLQRFIADVYPLDKIDLWKNDSLACAIYTNKIFDVKLNTLNDKKVSSFKPYTLVDFFKWVEFQQQGKSTRLHSRLTINPPNE
ncbi:hypothetical protein IscW_ISCW007026 [Ixodes scapularis]|uniref:Uncharacterized protein n=1 Tax=Ixodes scapularis TaxID=6945 RepID=B7PVL1_IXOSC|nr:hypothetical protein IscW_ISCW007026 [Ixodes scapularis]|eukprot:XP_002408156.1 hypothetical protein IscW_ISCW007026 [Ixodes scapularis]